MSRSYALPNETQSKHNVVKMIHKKRKEQLLTTLSVYADIISNSHGSCHNQRKKRKLLEPLNKKIWSPGNVRCKKNP